jgi:hypothetical protein
MVDDVLSYKKMVQSTIEECNTAMEESATLAPTMTTPQHARWRGNMPYLRLIMCIVVNDNIRNAYLHRGDAMSRTELDAQNSDDVREPTVYEMIADKWNDESFNPTVPVSSVHEDFKQEILASHDKVRVCGRPRRYLTIFCCRLNI